MVLTQTKEMGFVDGLLLVDLTERFWNRHRYHTIYTVGPLFHGHSNGRSFPYLSIVPQIMDR